MPWQEIGVVIVVIGAVVYLARKLFASASASARRTRRSSRWTH
jgi:type II secretory pathway pseudopilin PulG